MSYMFLKEIDGVYYATLGSGTGETSLDKMYYDYKWSQFVISFTHAPDTLYYFTGESLLEFLVDKSFLFSYNF